MTCGDKHLELEPVDIWDVKGDLEQFQQSPRVYIPNAVSIKQDFNDF
jgi:hypothetical protein